MSGKIGIDSTVNCVAEKLLVSGLGEESVMMNIETGDYFGLNEVGSTIWNLIKEPIQVKVICEKLLEDFDIDEHTCKEKTIAYLEHLLEEDMLEVN